MTTSQEGYAKEGGGAVKKALATTLLAAALAIPALAGAASAVDRVQAGRTIEAFTGTDLVNVQGYPANRAVTIDVLRNGVRVSSVTGRTDAEGFTEFNHVGGGQVSQGGDCFKPPSSPDVIPGDVIRTRTAGDRAGVRDSAVVRDTGIDFDSIDTNTLTNTIRISGHVRSRPDARIVPGTDVLELRLNKGNVDNTWETGPGLDQDRPGRRDLRVDIGENVQANGNWTRTLRVSNDDAVDWRDNPGEVGLEWSAGAVGGEEASPPAIFVADEGGGEAIAGCPPVAENGVTSTNPRVLNKATVGSGVRITGIARNATGTVSVTINDGDNATPPVRLDATLRNAGLPGFQTWRTNPMTVGQRAVLRRLDDGRLTANASVGGTSLRILKDTVAPARAPKATPRPGTYPRTQVVTLSSQARATVRYQLGKNKPVTANSPEFVRPIKIASSRTIRAAAFDPAGNRGPAQSFRYTIRRR